MITDVGATWTRLKDINGTICLEALERNAIGLQETLLAIHRIAREATDPAEALLEIQMKTLTPVRFHMVRT